MGDHERKELRLRYDGSCRECDAELRRGERALYERATKSVICMPCGVGPGTAGRSARRVHQRRRARHDDRVRERYGALGAAASRLTRAPQHVQAWDKGAKGEELVGKRLERLLAGTGVSLLHDRRIPGSRANIDHIAIGPGGVTVVDAKNYKGKVRVERSGGLLSARTGELRINGRRQTRLVESVLRQVDVIGETLAASGFERVDLRAALCFANPDGLPLFRRQHLSGVLIDGARSAARLASRDGELSEEAVARIYRELAVRLPAA